MEQNRKNDIEYIKEMLSKYEKNNRPFSEQDELIETGFSNLEFGVNDGDIKICKEVLFMLENDTISKSPNEFLNCLNNVTMLRLNIDLTKYMSEELKNNPDFILKLLEERKSLIKNDNIIGQELRADNQFMQKIKQYKNDRLFMRIAISEDPKVYECLPGCLRSDLGFVKKILKDCIWPEMLEEFLNDDEKKMLQEFLEQEKQLGYRNDFEKEMRDTLSSCSIDNIDKMQRKVQADSIEIKNEAQKGDEEK